MKHSRRRSGRVELETNRRAVTAASGEGACEHQRCEQSDRGAAHARSLTLTRGVAPHPDGNQLNATSPQCVRAISEVQRNPANSIYEPNAITNITIFPINAAYERTDGIDPKSMAGQKRGER
jgi:hypothetical protein